MTTYVVGLPMLFEAATALLLLFRRPEGVPLSAALIGLAFVAVVWLSTALLQVPRHTILGSDFDRNTWVNWSSPAGCVPSPGPRGACSSSG